MTPFVCSFIEFLVKCIFGVWFLLAETSEESEEKEKSYGSIMLERLTGSQDGRIDHVLQVCIFISLFTHLLMNGLMSARQLSGYVLSLKMDSEKHLA